MLENVISLKIEFKYTIQQNVIAANYLKQAQNKLENSCSYEKTQEQKAMHDSKCGQREVRQYLKKIQRVYRT